MIEKLVQLVLGPGVVHVRDRFVREELRSATEITGQDALLRIDQ